MPVPAEQQQLVERVKPPAHAKVVARANEFVARTRMSVAEFAEELRREYGYGGRSTLLFYLRGEYAEHPSVKSTRYQDARVWDYIERHWPQPDAPLGYDDLLETKGYRIIRDCFEEAREEGINALIYGPPSSEKSAVLETLCAQRAAHEDAYYIYASESMTPLGMLRAVAHAAQVWVARAYMKEQLTEAIIRNFAARPTLPVLVFDEAQHLPVATIERIRQLHDRTRRRDRKGCGIILAGSHNLYSYFMHPARRPRLEQVLSRFPTRRQLEGMQRDEVLRLAARAFGNGKPAKFTAEQERRLLDRCAFEDPYATDAKGAPLRDKGRMVVRYSSRRLLEYIRLQKRGRVERVLAEEVA